jgi:hypothetical protein
MDDFNSSQIILILLIVSGGYLVSKSLPIIIDFSKSHFAKADHPKGPLGTPLEQNLVNRLDRYLSDSTVINPDTKVFIKLPDMLVQDTYRLLHIRSYKVPLENIKLIFKSFYDNQVPFDSDIFYLIINETMVNSCNSWICIMHAHDFKYYIS